jgi:hypothetical protein
MISFKQPLAIYVMTKILQQDQKTVISEESLQVRGKRGLTWYITMSGGVRTKHGSYDSCGDTAACCDFGQHITYLTDSRQQISQTRGREGRKTNEWK